MKKRIKKGFTLVELLVVIAILAILSTVAIIGYNSFTEKAEKSADEQAVTQMNKLLSAEETSGNTIDSVGEVTTILRENGYSENFQTYFADYDLAWIASENAIVLVEDDKIVYPSSYTKGTYTFEVLNPYSEDIGELIDTKNEIKDGDTLTINQNIEAANSTDLTFDKDAEYAIDLNGKKLSTNIASSGNAGVVVNAGKVDISNGQIESGEDVKTALRVQNGAEANIDDVILTGGQKNGIAAYVATGSTMTITDSKIFGNEGTNSVQCYGGNLVLNDVTVSQIGQADSAWYSSAIQVVNYMKWNETVGKYQVLNQANAEINGGTYMGDKAIQISAPGGNVTINGGTFTGSTYVINADFAPQNYYEGDKFTSIITINEGTFTGNLKTSAATVLVINGGTFNGSFKNVKSTDIQITGGTFTNTGLTQDQFMNFVTAGSTVVFEGTTLTK